MAGFYRIHWFIQFLPCPKHQRRASLIAYRLSRTATADSKRLDAHWKKSTVNTAFLHIKHTPTTMSFRSIICILAYDQKCIDSICLPVTNENSNELSDYSNSCGATVNIAWFDTILNHSLIVLNVVTSVLLLRILTKLTACGKKRISGGSEIFASKTKHDNPGETTTMADEWTDEEKKKYFLFLHSEKRKIFRPKYIPSVLSLMFGESEWDFWPPINTMKTAAEC